MRADLPIGLWGGSWVAEAPLGRRGKTTASGWAALYFLHPSTPGSETYEDRLGIEHNSPFGLYPLLDCLFQVQDVAGERASCVDQRESVFG